MAFRTQLSILCDAGNCDAEFATDTDVMLILAEEAIIGGWFIDAETGKHFCPTHRPQPEPVKVR